MANKKKAKPQKRRRWLRIALLSVVLACVSVLGWMSIEARVLHLEYVDLQLADLPQPFEGTKILYVSDLHIDWLNQPERVYAMMESLNQLSPDLVLLGGDYTSFGLNHDLQMVARINTYESAKQQEATLRDRFFLLMKNFAPPLGKYAVAGNHDAFTDGLRQSMALGGVTLLQNEVAVVEKDREKLYLVGLDDWTTGVQKVSELAAQVRGRDLVIALSHNPDALPQVSNHPAKDGKQWADLMLSGHTHGGQVRPLGITIINMSGYGYLTGWRLESGTELLVSNGVGTTGLPLRLGAPAQAHLITLHGPNWIPEP